MELPSNVLSILTMFGQEDSLASAYLQPLDLAPDESSPPWASDPVNTAIALQYWPESLQDSRSVEWNPRSIPGGSHPIYQWTHGGERRLSFTAVFTTDTVPDDTVILATEILNAAAELNPFGGEWKSPYETQADVPLSGIQLGKRDLDLRVVVSWLRWFTYPAYGTGNDIRAYEPAKCILVMPNTGLGYNGTDYVITVMTQCDVTYEAWFPNGFPRIIEVSLEFAEVVQQQQRVQFHDRQNMTPASAIGNFLRTSGTAIE